MEKRVSNDDGFGDRRLKKNWHDVVLDEEYSPVIRYNGNGTHSRVPHRFAYQQEADTAPHSGSAP